MFRPLFAYTAPVFAILALIAAPALAQNGNSAFFVAELAAPASKGQIAAGGVVWHCEGTQCRAARSTARALRICSSLRRDVGTLVSFTAGQTPFNAADLARCNG